MTVVRLLLAAAIAASPVAADAQDNALLNGVSTADIVQLFKKAEMTAVALPGVSGQDFTRGVEVKLTPDASFYVMLRACPSAAAEARCGLVQPYASFGSGSATLSVLNKFNHDDTMISTLLMNGQGEILLRAKIVAEHGVTTRNLALNIGLFLRDVSGAIDALGAAASTVSYDGAGDERLTGTRTTAGEKATPLQSVIWVGKATPNVDPAVIERLRHIAEE